MPVFGVLHVRALADEEVRAISQGREVRVPGRVAGEGELPLAGADAQVQGSVLGPHVRRGEGPHAPARRSRGRPRRPLEVARPVAPSSPGLAVGEPIPLLDPLLGAHRTAHYQRPAPRRAVLRVDVEQVQAAEVVAVQVRQEDRVQVGGVEAGALEPQERGRAEVHAEGALAVLHEEAGVASPAGVEGIGASDDGDADGHETTP